MRSRTRLRRHRLGNGERLLVIATQDDGFRGYVYRPAQGRLAVEFTGMTLPGLSIEERLLDLDGDGDWEFVRGGGETLITTYATANRGVAKK